MPWYHYQNKCAFSDRRNTSKDLAHVTSSGRLFQILRFWNQTWQMVGHWQWHRMMAECQ